MANLQFALYLILAGLAGAVISAIRCEMYYAKRLSDNFRCGVDLGIQIEKTRLRGNGYGVIIPKGFTL